MSTFIDVPECTVLRKSCIFTGLLFGREFAGGGCLSLVGDALDYYCYYSYFISSSVYRILRFFFV